MTQTTSTLSTYPKIQRPARNYTDNNYRQQDSYKHRTKYLFAKYFFNLKNI
jgi:Zn-finger nucleic acid-binding protein